LSFEILQKHVAAKVGSGFAATFASGAIVITSDNTSASGATTHSRRTDFVFIVILLQRDAAVGRRCRDT